MRKKILLIEDDRAFRETTAAFLEAEGFRVRQAGDGAQGLKAAEQDKPDLVLLDVMLPVKGGIEVCKALRENGAAVPIICISGEKREEIDKVLSLELGADDYMIKPFGQRELLARIHAVLRRGRPEEPDLEEFAFADVVINFKQHTTLKGRSEIYLTAKEYDLLKLLIRREGDVIDRDTLLNEVWGYEHFPTTRTVDTFIHNLRKKIEDDPSLPRYLITVPRAGYKFMK